MPPELDREARLDEVIAAYLKGVQHGSAPGRQDLLDSHPDLADELASFFADQDRIALLAAPLRAAAAPAFRTPRLRDFGDYEVQEEIARGGMGVVFKAWQKSLNRVVALKMLLAGPLASADDLRRFRAEAEAAARLDHPHIVPIHDVGVHDGHPYLSMKLLEGGTLAAARGRPRRDAASQREAAGLVAAIADAVHFAHQRGILHRDLKPANILLDGEGRPYVSDFGLAKRTQTWAVPASWSPGTGQLSPTVPLPPPTQTGAVVGTPAYMAPEQASGQGGVVTTAADVYGLGAVLYELLTGRPPHQAATPLETLRLVLEQEPARPRSLNAAVDRDLETICLKCLHKEPGRRYASAAALADDLRRFLAGEPILARPAGALERTWRRARRHPVVTGLVLALMLSLIGGFALAVGLWLRAELLFEDAETKRSQLAAQAVVLEQERDRARQAEAGEQLKKEEAERREAEAEASFRQAHEVVNKLSALGNDLARRPGMQALCRDLQQTALGYYQEFLRQRGQDPAVRKELADAQHSAADLLAAVGTQAEAQAAYRRSLELFRDLNRDRPGDAEIEWKYADSYNSVGMTENDTEAAIASYKEAKRLFDEFLRGHPDDERLLAGLATALSNLGSRYVGSGRFDDARDALKESVRIDEELLKVHPHRIGVTSDLATALGNLAALYSRQPGKLDDALTCYTRARGYNETLAKALPGDPRYQADLASSLDSIGMIQRERGDKEEALKTLLDALKRRQKLADDNPGVTRYQWDLAFTERNLGVTYARKGDPEKALTFYERARDHFDKLRRQDPESAGLRKELGLSWFNVATIHGSQGRWPEEHKALAEARPLQEKLVHDDPNNLDARCDYGRTLINLGLVLFRLNRLDDARDALQQGIDSQLYALDRGVKAPGPRFLLNGLYMNKSLVERAAGRPDDSVTATQERLKWCADDADELYRGVREFCAAGTVYGKGKKDLGEDEQAGRARCADLAMQTLRQAVSRGFKDVGRLQKERELDLLRSRDDFRKLVAELEAKP